MWMCLAINITIFILKLLEYTVFHPDSRLGINMFNNKLRHNDLFLEKRSTIEIVTKYVNACVDMVIVVFAVIISEYM